MDNAGLGEEVVLGGEEGRADEEGVAWVGWGEVEVCRAGEGSRGDGDGDGGRIPPARMHGQLAQSLASRNLVTSRRRMPACLEGELRLHT